MPISPSSVAKPLLTFPRRISTWFTGEKERSAWEPSHQYCDRLLHVYWELSANEGDRPSRLVSEIPLWAQDTIAVIGRDVSKGIAALEAVPRLQAALADCTAYTPAKWLLEKELDARSSRPGSNQPTWNGTGDVYDAASKAQLAGLAFSGGGIRSATFALGILQALASRDQIKRFDYLSTVSGGGYIHQWLASWICNEPGTLQKVQGLLKPLPEAGSPARMPWQIQWLRRYSSYLTPQAGLFSADTWTMLCIWFRNTFLNQIVLFGFLASCLLAIRGALYPFFSDKPYAIARITPLHLGPICLGSYLLFASITLARALHAQRASSRHESDPPSRRKPKPGPLTPPAGAIGNAGVLWKVVLPTFLLAVYAGLIAHRPLSDSTRLFFQWEWPAAILLLQLAVIFGGLWPSDPTKWKEMDIFVMIMSLISSVGSVVGLRYVAIRLVSEGHHHANSWLKENLRQWADGVTNALQGTPASNIQILHSAIHTANADAIFALLIPTVRIAPSSIRPVNMDMLFAILVPIVFFALQFTAIRLLIGVMGRNLSESRSEWMARFGAWSGLFGAIWLILSSIAMLAPTLCDWILTRSFWHRVSAFIGVVALHASTLYAGGSGKSDGKPKAGTFFGYSALDLFGMIGAPICILSLLIILSGIVERAAAAANVAGGLMVVFYLAAVIVAVFLFFGWRVDVNQFSMHGFYRNRLARCYLGGTNPCRDADPFTGFDDHAETRAKTGMKISSLLPARFSSDPTTKYDGPFPIFCATLNLTFGEDLAYQERKGTSFAFTPLYSGYHVGWTNEKSSKRADTTFNGYAPTANFAYRRGGITLPECAAVSGAALNPNQGVNTQPALAFLMTLFNARLGWWLANPRKPRIWPSENRSPTPWFGLRYLLGELFGMADDTSKFVCLSDGGQFENMGLYELVRRRCSFIVVCDAEADPTYAFGGMGGAIAKCRLDFGTEITLPLEDLRPATTHPWFSGVHFVEGTIRYPAPPDGRLPEYTGRIFYLKTTITGKEPGDILRYRLARPTFPNESTLNQWFTESQFESYRRLGQLIGEEAIAKFPVQSAAS